MKRSPQAKGGLLMVHQGSKTAAEARKVFDSFLQVLLAGRLAVDLCGRGRGSLSEELLCRSSSTSASSWEDDVAEYAALWPSRP